ncbi:unnamed protein product [Brassicogethes aeneus]|uniref:Nuclear envelope integral membrane protein 1 n=1 Tax=Brassicogethes aeneus TaxID=1431903 RepID=A0A9P0B3N3_BRAAE|nr:unnamed protein product [Brassicogethes aeneus]
MKLFIFSLFIFCINAKTSAPVYHLEQGVNVKIESSFTKRLNIFCYYGKPKYIIHLWQTVLFKINHPSKDYSRYDGPTEEIVEKEYMKKHYSWSLNIFSTQERNVKLNPFNDSCIGIESKEAYNVTFNIIRIDLWKLLYLIFGVLLFISAPQLSKNTIFYYVCGIIFGICTSLLILIYIASKIIPRKPFMYGVLGCGWTVVIYVLQILWDNIRMILEHYKLYVIWYMLATGFISFILCYRWGPVENERTINLIKWSLQITGLTLMFFSSHFQEAAMAQIVVLILFYNIPKSWFLVPKRYWVRKFPPKVKLLTNDEYYEEGVKETKKALEELRNFCSSPECNQWKMALKLHNVKRFASFVEGNSHLSDDEILEYETSIQGGLTDEEDENYTDED